MADSGGLRPAADRIEIIGGDITELEVDAIVNAANSSLAGGGGVDGAIHRRAGPGLLEECLALGGCETGSAEITAGHELPAKFVIHAVGPVWRGGGHDEEALLASCYRTSLELAVANRCRTVAFPAISCGAYRFPVDRAAEIAVGEIADFLSATDEIDSVKLVGFESEVRSALDRALAPLRAESSPQ